MFYYIKNCCVVFQFSLIYSHCDSVLVLVALHPCQHLDNHFFNFSYLVGMKWYLVVLFWISLRANDVSYGY